MAQLLGPKYVDLRRLPAHAPPNFWDGCLQEEASLVDGLQRRISATDVEEPWRAMPKGGKPFEETSVTVTGATLNAAVNTDVLTATYRVPEGWDGIVLSVVNQWSGAGFIEGSGDLVWRININGTQYGYYAINYGNIKTQLGSLQNRYSLEGAGILIRSNQTINYYTRATVNTLDPTGRSICSLKGYIWPRRGITNL